MTEFALVLLNLKTMPEWLDGLCLMCVYNTSGYVDTDAGEVATEDHLNQFLSDRMALLADRAAKGKPLGRCEVLTGGMFIGDPDDLPCRRLAEVEREGHQVCHIHKNRMREGKKLAFSPEDAHRPKPYVIWARSASELIARARLLAGVLVP